VDDIGLTVRDGEIVGIIGTNGSGKTTLINLITVVAESDLKRVAMLTQRACVIERGEVVEEVSL
jgi:ABC-type branched-subunit amino acid transport system ATPase component